MRGAACPWTTSTSVRPHRCRIFRALIVTFSTCHVALRGSFESEEAQKLPEGPPHRLVAVDGGHPEEAEGGRMGGQDESQRIIMAWMGPATQQWQNDSSGLVAGQKCH